MLVQGLSNVQVGKDWSIFEALFRAVLLPLLELLLAALPVPAPATGEGHDDSGDEEDEANANEDTDWISRWQHAKLGTMGCVFMAAALPMISLLLLLLLGFDSNERKRRPRVLRAEDAVAFVVAVVLAVLPAAAANKALDMTRSERNGEG